MGWIAGYTSLALFGAAFLIGIITRIPAVYSDAIKEIEAVSTMGC